jgi:ribonuclease HI
VAFVEIWTDGSAWGANGGWAALLVSGSHRKEIHGAVVGPDVTNQVMEMVAVMKALEALKGTGHEVVIYTDSAYVANAFLQGWLTNWRRNGWKTYSGSPVANRQWWETLEGFVEMHDVTFKHVKGHAGNANNEIVDRLASAARRAAAYG